jgi:hypothetical protein
MSVSPILKLIAFVLFIPEELSFSLFQFRLTWIRLVLFLFTPVLLVRFSHLLASRKCHLVFSDVLIALTGVWMIVSPAMLFDLGYSLHHSAPIAMEFCGGYFAARTLLSQRGQALSFINLLCHVIAIVALLGILDALTDRPLIHDFLRQLNGLPMLTEGDGVLEHRAGILRAMGPIDHPILYGAVCGIGFLVAIASPIRAKGPTIAACGVGALLSLSSAPIQGAFLGIGLLAYDMVFSRFRGRWRFLIVIGLLGIATLYAFTSSPFASLFGRLNFNPQTYWVRLMQWEMGGAVVRDSPWLGVAFEWPEIVARMPYFVPNPSIDSLWLNLALIYGIPGAVLVALSMVGVTCHPTRGRGVNLTMQESKLATALSIVIFIIILLGFTVDFWEASWILIGLVVGARAHLGDLGLQRSSSSFTKTREVARSRPSLQIKRGRDDNAPEVCSCPR